jgi:hypothetical protein
MMLTSSFFRRTSAAVALLWLSVAPVLAQSVPPSSAPFVDVVIDEPVSAPKVTTAIINGPEDSLVGRTIILDASDSRIVGSNPEYLWYIEGQREPISRKIDAIYTPEKEGVAKFRVVIRTTVDNQVREATVTHAVTIYRRKILMVTDPSSDSQKIEAQRVAAEEAGIYLKVIRPEADNQGHTNQDAIDTLLQNHLDDIETADVIILRTDGVAGLQGMMAATESDVRRSVTLGNQTIAVVVEGSLSRVARILRGPFYTLQPRRIVLIRPEAVNLLTTTPSADAFLAQAEARDLDMQILDEHTASIHPWNVISLLVMYLLTHGVPSQTVILLLMLPVIATILAFLRQVIGINTFGLFTPSIVALSFLALGWWVGLLFLIFIVATGYATRAVMRRWPLLFIPKVAIILTVGSLTLLILLAVGAAAGVHLSRDAVFILLIMSTLSENFLTAKTEQGFNSAVLAIGQTVFAALLCVAVVSLPFFQSLILAYPELILLTILINVLLGRFTGLRLSEYFRFREVFKHMAEEE